MSLHTITMPDLGEGIAEVELVEWRVQPGDTVAEDQILCDVMTDKAAVEVPSPVAGRVAELGGEIGQMMAVGSVLIRIEVETDAASSAPDAAPRLERIGEVTRERLSQIERLLRAAGGLQRIDPPQVDLDDLFVSVRTGGRFVGRLGGLGVEIQRA